MDRASASEAGNVGSTPAGRIFLTKILYFVVTRLVGYLRLRRVSTVFLLTSCLEIKDFILKNIPVARSKQTALLASGGEGRSDVFV